MVIYKCARQCVIHETWMLYSKQARMEYKSFLLYWHETPNFKYASCDINMKRKIYMWNNDMRYETLKVKHEYKVNI